MPFWKLPWPGRRDGARAERRGQVPARGWQPGPQSPQSWYFALQAARGEETMPSIGLLATCRYPGGPPEPDLLWPLLCVAAIGRGQRDFSGEKVARAVYFPLGTTRRASGIGHTSTVGTVNRAGFNWDRMLEQIKLLKNNEETWWGGRGGAGAKPLPTFLPPPPPSSGPPWSVDGLRWNLLAGEKKEVGGMGHRQPSLPAHPMSSLHIMSCDARSQSAPGMGKASQG